MAQGKGIFQPFFCDAYVASMLGEDGGIKFEAGFLEEPEGEEGYAVVSRVLVVLLAPSVFVVDFP